jgi:hypothetical protein
LAVTAEKRLRAVDGESINADDSQAAQAKVWPEEAARAKGNERSIDAVPRAACAEFERR